MIVPSLEKQKWYYGDIIMLIGPVNTGRHYYVDRASEQVDTVWNHKRYIFNQTFHHRIWHKVNVLAK